MNIMKKILMGVCFAIPLVTYAGWQVSQPAQSDQPFFQAGPMATSQAQAPFNSNKQIPDKFKAFGEGAPVYSVTLQPGTLQENVQRINSLLPKPWDIKWMAQEDYPVTGQSTVSGSNLYEVMGKIFEYYPVRAEFYTQNHVMAIVTRKPS